MAGSPTSPKFVIDTSTMTPAQIRDETRRIVLAGYAHC